MQLDMKGWLIQQTNIADYNVPLTVNTYVTADSDFK